MERGITQLTPDHSQLPLQKIGQGYCGTVWANLEPGQVNADVYRLVLKSEGGRPGCSLPYELEIHEHLLGTLRMNRDSDIAKSGFRVNIPFCLGFLDQNSRSWPRILPRLPSGFKPCKALVNEKIPSMPGQIRTLLSRAYHPQVDSTASIEDDHCLVQVYLGCRRHHLQEVESSGPVRLSVSSLRDFPLHIDQIEELGLPAKDYATAMADTLAFLY
jgi:hypothetical protein